MELIPSFAKLKDIIIDPYNPRFINQGAKDQNLLLQDLLGKKYVKDLLRSMQVDIKWVNRIVVQRITTHEHSDSLIGMGEYVVVEGNTRTVCLKSGKIEGINEDSEIPILLAEKESDETDDDFHKEIRVTQGIANVTVVKEWEPISKARHLRKMYDGFRDANPESKPSHIHKLIADELGKTVNEVRQAVIRFTIYKKISDLSDTIPEDKFGYIEAIDKNKETREIFGMDPVTNEIVFEEGNETHEIKQELLEKIPDLIKMASNQGINTKQFRDVITNNLTADLDKNNSLLNDIVDIESPITFHSLIDGDRAIDLEEQWQLILDRIFEDVSSYPLMEDWAIEDLDKLKSIKAKIDKIVTVLNEI
ncbi:hypothetical protein DEU53_10220 [Pantoea sp. AG1095]|uniref:hypothetical protein n=1 Tax=Pantoea sp. AG1095 TaxID=2184004 RepID=UPI000D8E4752|nr:hypothetical protein [Pantoea sp. AG1095]PYG50069.1 hypothetical protein DEU53_10220 [Pantoea sp. AG1095]